MRYQRANQTSNLDRPSYLDTRKSSEKSKKIKKSSSAHLAISLLKPRGKEIREFPLYQLWAKMAMSKQNCSRIAISSFLSKFFLFFSEPLESSEYPSTLLDPNPRSVRLYGAFFHRWRPILHLG